MLELFLKILPPKKILEFQDWRKTAKLIQKRKHQLYRDELYQLYNTQAEGAKVGATLLWLISGRIELQM